MNCVICKNGNIIPGNVTFTLERGKLIIIFKQVPALVCQNCGDFYLTPEITKILLDKANQTVSNGVEFEIINFKSAA